MPRDLSAAMNAATLDQVRRPAFKVEIFDLASDKNSITDVVAGIVLDPTTGPRDFTDDCLSVQVLERGGDYSQSGLASSTVELVVLDPHQLFDPANLLDDPTGDGRWLRRGNVVRVTVGDSRFAVKTFGHPTQFVEEAPLVSIAKILFAYGFLPRFDGLGRLSAFDQEITKSPERIYTDEQDGLMVGRIESLHGEVNPFNSAKVVGLDTNMTKIVQPRQTLSEVRLTTGYFAQDEEEDVFWSEDRTLAAQNVELEVVKSVGLSLFGQSFGADEDFSLIATQAPGEGAVGATLEVSTGFAPAIIAVLASGYVAAAFIPDEVIVAVGAGVTIPVGRVIQAVLLSGVLLIMTRIGRGTYRFTGEPIEYVFLELVGRAEVAGLKSWERNPLEVENHILGTQADVDAAARAVLFFQQAKGNPRRITMLHDLRMQPGDILERPHGRRYLFDEVGYTLTREQNEPLVAQVSAFEVTPGVFQ